MELHEIIEYISQMLSDLLPAFWLLGGLSIVLMVIKVIIRISDFETLGKKNVQIKRVPSWVIEEDKHHARTLEYQLRIHHHRARVSKGTSRKP